MRVLITRPEREATALATALAERGHAPVIAPLFRLRIPASARRLRRGARRLPGRAADQRQRRARAGRGERAARPADPGGRRHHGQRPPRGWASAPSPRRRAMARPWPSWCASASIPRTGPLLHVLGRRGRGRPRRAAAAGGLRGEALRALRGARGDRAARIRRARRWRRARSTSPPSSRRARRRCSPRMVEDAGLAADTCATSPPSPSARPRSHRSAGLPFKATVAAERPTRQAVLDEIDRLAEARRTRTADHERYQRTRSSARRAAAGRRRPCRCGAAWAWSAPS